VPSMQSVCKSTHQVAVAADEEAASRDHAKMNNAANILRESFSKSINDRKEFNPDAGFDEEGSKKAAVLSIVNELFRIYFRLNTLRLCKNLVKPVEAKKLHEDGLAGPMVTYRYFTGRLYLFEDNYAAAEENLEYAFNRCHRNAISNKRRILQYLVPVKIYRGKLPSNECKSLCIGRCIVLSMICLLYFQTTVSPSTVEV
jgi:nuclear mRNA export protein PCID2/THP1